MLQITSQNYLNKIEGAWEQFGCEKTKTKAPTTINCNRSRDIIYLKGTAGEGASGPDTVENVQL